MSNPTPNIADMIDEPPQFMESSIEAKQIQSSIPNQDNSISSGMVASPFSSLPSQRMGIPNTPTATPFSSQPLPFGQGSDTFANSHRADGGNSSLTNTIPSTMSTGLFRGKSARELLTEFYREKNPSKISDVDNLLIKYQVRILMSNGEFLINI
jgi:hypothetical protein